MKIVITIPAYNEEKTIEEVIHDINLAMEGGKYDYEIMVLDDGSNDKTVEIAKNAGAVIFSHPYNYGLAETFKTGIEQALDTNLT